MTIVMMMVVLATRKLSPHTIYPGKCAGWVRKRVAATIRRLGTEDTARTGTSRLHNSDEYDSHRKCIQLGNNYVSASERERERTKSIIDEVVGVHANQ